jgi:predicted RNA binding protein YcfA (HicA-like mRNA interferase family)
MEKRKRTLLKLAKKHGFSVHRVGKHYVFQHPTAGTMTCSISPSDNRALKNQEATMKRLIKQADQSH